MDKAPHPNAAKVFLNWVLSKEGQTAIQKEGETNDSLRIDIPKDDVAPVMRRRSGAQYVVTWTPEWMNMKPIQELVVQALGGARKK
jgi:ABC-type Fe3+ transport system substrate-binding protein